MGNPSLDSRHPVATDAPARESGSPSIRARSILILLSAILPILVIQAYIYYERFQSARARAFEANLEVSRAVSKAFGAFVQDIVHQELGIGLVATASPPPPEKELLRVLDGSDNDYKPVVSFSWVAPDGSIQASSARDIVCTNVSDRPYFQEILSGRESAISDLVLGKLNGNPIFTISRAVRDDEGNLLGLVVAAVDPSKLDAVLAVERSNGGGVSLMDRQGMLVYRYPHLNLTWHERQWLNEATHHKKALGGEEITAVVKPAHEKKPRMVALTPVKSIGWVAGAGVSEEDVMAPIYSSLFHDAGISCFAILLASLTAIYLSRGITGPIRRLEKHARDLQSGRFDSRVEIAGPPEVNRLAVTMNQMAQEIKCLVESTTAATRLAEQRASSLRESEERFRAVVESAPDAIFIQTEGRFAYLNPAARHLFGAGDEAQLVGSPVLEQFHPECREAVHARIRRVNEERRSVPLQEEKLLRGDGTEVDIEVAAVPFSYKGSAGALVFVRDITRRKQMENEREHLTAELAVEKARWQATVENMVDPVTVCDAEGRVTYMNPAYERMVGRSVGVGLSMEMHPKYYQLYRPDGTFFAVEELPLQKAAREGREVRNVEVVQHSEDGREFATIFSAAPLRDPSGRVTGAVAVGRDITEQRQTEEELRRARDELEERVQERTSELARANEELRGVPSRLIAVQEEERKRLASELHDSIGQTLAAIKFGIETVLLTKKMGDTERAFKQLEDFVPTLQRSIEETRSIYMGLRPKTLEEMGLLATFDWFIREFRKLYPQIHVEPDIGIEEGEIPEDLKITIFRITQEALNNIARHSRAEWVDVSLMRRGAGIELTVSDDGVGMDLAYILESSTAKSLGLTGMKERAQFTGGVLSIESTPGEGTTVRAFWSVVFPSYTTAKR